eukprot:Awhi_evm1s3804
MSFCFTKLFLAFNMGTIGALGSAIPRSSSREFLEFGKGPYIVEHGDVSKTVKGLTVGDRQGCQKACESDSSCVGYFTYVNPKGYFHSDSPPKEDQICRLMVDSSVYSFDFAEEWDDYLPETKVDVYYDKNFKCPKGKFLGYLNAGELQEMYAQFGCSDILKIGDDCSNAGGAVSVLNGNLDKGCVAGATCEYRDGDGKCWLPETKEIT